MAAIWLVVNSYHVTTPDSRLLISTHKHLFLFDVMACSHMLVALSNGTHVTYEVRIDDDGGKLIIRPLAAAGSQVSDH